MLELRWFRECEDSGRFSCCVYVRWHAEENYSECMTCQAKAGAPSAGAQVRQRGGSKGGGVPKCGG